MKFRLDKNSKLNWETEAWGCFCEKWKDQFWISHGQQVCESDGEPINLNVNDLALV